MQTVEKCTQGCVIQVFDKDSGECVCQYFLASDQVAGATQMYHPFDMVNPQNAKSQEHENANQS